MDMTRAEKYPDTDTFTYYNANPKNRITADCAIRAIATATGIPYNDVVRGLAEIQCETGYEPTMGKGLELYMKSIGWVKHPQPRKPDGTKYTGAEFCSRLWHMGAWDSVVCNIGGHHMVAIKEVRCAGSIRYRYKVHDIWNSTGRCVGNFWTKG